MIENKDIKFKVLYEGGDVVSKFATLDKTIEKTGNTVKSMGTGFSNANSMLMSTGRIVQDLPYGFMGISNNITFLAEQFAYARTQGVSFSAALKGIFSSMMGTGGIVFAISMLTTGLTYLSMQNTKSTKEIEDFADILDRAAENAKNLKKELRNVSDELKDALSPSFIQWLLAGGNTAQAMINNMQGADYVSATNRQRELLKEQDKQNQLTKIATNLTTDYGKSISEVVKQNMLRNKDLKFIQGYLEDELDKIPKVSEAYKHYADALKRVDELLSGKSDNKNTINSAAKERLSEFNDMLKEMYDTIMKTEYKVAHGQLQPKSPWGVLRMGKVPEGKDFNTDFFDAKAKKQWLEENKFMIETLKDSLDIIKGEFSTLWQNVFGEANSLFEKLLMNFASRLAERGIGSLFGSLLSLIPGGSFFSGLFNQSLGGGPQIINLQADNRTLATFYVTGKREAERLRF